MRILYLSGRKANGALSWIQVSSMSISQFRALQRFMFTDAALRRVGG